MQQTIFDDPEISLLLAGTLCRRSSLDIPESPMGVGFECLDRKLFLPEKCYDLMGESGVKHARCQTGWSRCETVKGSYDFAWLDAVVDNLLQRGIEPWFNLGFGNILYMSDVPHESAVGFVPTAFGPECVDAWCRYVSALARHFKTRVHHFEIWNEPDLELFWQPEKPSGKRYAEFIRLTAPRIRKEIPSAKIGGCSGGYWVDQQIPGFRFLHDALREGMGNDIDFFAIHSYGKLPELGFRHTTDVLKEMFREYAPHVELWQGECGYPSTTYGHSDSCWGIVNATEDAQARFVCRRAVLDLSCGYVLSSYFHIADLMENSYRVSSGKPRKPVMLGLLHGKTYTPKAAYRAFCSMCAILDSRTKPRPLTAVPHSPFDTLLSGALPSLGLEIHTFERNGYPVYSYYFAEDLERVFFGDKRFGLLTMHQTGKPISSPVLIDPLTGNVYRMESRMTNREGYLYFEHLPLTNYPLFLTDEQAFFWNKGK